MGRLGSKSTGENGRSFANTVQYTKLSSTSSDEQYTGCDEKLQQVMPSFEGYNISFSCRQCGHLQIFQGAELEMILGKSLKMAFRSRRKEQPPDNATTSSFDQGNSADMVLKDNIPMTVQTNYKPFQESLDGSSIGIPVIPTRPQPVTRSTLSSDESNSPTQMNQFKRIAEKPSLMKRIGKGYVVSVSDEEGYPLVSDGSSSIPGSQTNISLLNADPGSNEAATLRLGDVRPDSPRRLVGSQPIGMSKVQNSQCGTSSGTIEDMASRVRNSSEFNERERNLRIAPWYQEGIPREIALEILSQEPIGSFMVRRSTTKMGCFALSVRVPRTFQQRGIAHYLIMRTSKGYRIKGFTKDFPTLGSLIAHHSVMPELLPCPLSLSRYHPVCVISDCRRDFADIEPEPDG